MTDLFCVPISASKAMTASWREISVRLMWRACTPLMYVRFRLRILSSTAASPAHRDSTTQWCGEFVEVELARQRVSEAVPHEVPNQETYGARIESSPGPHTKRRSNPALDIPAEFRLVLDTHLESLQRLVGRVLIVRADGDDSVIEVGLKAPRCRLSRRTNVSIEANWAAHWINSSNVVALVPELNTASAPGHRLAQTGPSRTLFSRSRLSVQCPSGCWRLIEWWFLSTGAICADKLNAFSFVPDTLHFKRGVLPVDEVENSVDRPQDFRICCQTCLPRRRV